jgi:hypothetical protein
MAGWSRQKRANRDGQNIPIEVLFRGAHFGEPTRGERFLERQTHVDGAHGARGDAIVGA